MMPMICPNVTTSSDAEPLIHEYVCRVCGKKEKLVINAFQQLVASIIDKIDPICDVCAEAAENERIREEMSGRTDDLAIRAGVPEDFLTWDAKKGNNGLLKFCFSNLDKWVFIADRVDVGKTRAVCRAVKEAIKRDPMRRIKFYNVNRLASEYVGLSKANCAESAQLVRKLCELDMLVLDDLGKKGVFSDAICALLYEVTNALYERGAVLWITSNRPFSDCSKFFNSEVFEAVYSRFGRVKNAGRYAGWNFGGVE